MTALQIVNTSQEEITLPRRTYSQGSVIPARGKHPYTVKVLEDATDYEIHFIEYDYTKAKKIPVPVSADQQAADYFGNEKLRERGCFIKPVGEKITAEDLEKARETRKAWLQTLVEAGDEEFLRTKRVDNIPGVCKRAVRELGVKRDWAVTAPNATTQCEACAGRVELLDSGKPPILCTFCGYPMDKERAIAEGLWSPPEPKRGPGRPKKEPEAQEN